VTLAGMLFFRAVLRWRWWTALIAGVLLVPAAAAMWMAWDEMFMRSGVFGLIR